MNGFIRICAISLVACAGIEVLRCLEEKRRAMELANDAKAIANRKAEKSA